MNLRTKDNSTESNLDIKLVPEPTELLQEMAGNIEPGQVVRISRAIKPDERLRSHHPVVNRYEVARHSNGVVTVAIQKGYETYTRNVSESYKQVYRPGYPSYRPYEGSFLFLNGELVRATSSAGEDHVAYNMADLNDEDMLALNTLRDDALSGESEMAVGYIWQPKAFGEGFTSAFMKKTVQIDEV